MKGRNILSGPCGRFMHKSDAKFDRYSHVSRLSPAECPSSEFSLEVESQSQELCLAFLNSVKEWI